MVASVQQAHRAKTRACKSIPINLCVEFAVHNLAKGFININLPFLIPFFDRYHVPVIDAKVFYYPQFPSEVKAMKNSRAFVKLFMCCLQLKNWRP